MDRRRTKSLEGKCGSCRFFTVEQGRECTGFCSGRMKQKGRIERTYKCIGYDAAPPIYEEGGNAKQPQTNADRIRAMTDEELAELMEDKGDCPPIECPPRWRRSGSYSPRLQGLLARLAETGGSR